MTSRAAPEEAHSIDVTPDDDDMPGEIDFSQGKRGKFHRPGSTLNLPAQPANPAPQTAPVPTDDPLFGMWRDRQDMADVAAYIQRIRASRFTRDRSRRKT